MAFFKAYTHQKIFFKLLISFLFVGIIPLVLAGFAYYAVSYKILLQDTGSRTYENTMLVSSRLDKMILKNSEIIDAIESDKAFNKIFESGSDEPLGDNDKANLYNIIYLLLAEKVPKVGIYVMNASGSNILSNKQIPVEYDPVKFHNWGIFRKSNSEKDRVIIYSHKMKEKNITSRVLSIGKAVFSDNKIVGYIILDLYREHFTEMLSTTNNPDKLNIYIIDENLLLLFSPTGDQEGLLSNLSKKVHTELKPFTLFENGKQPFLFSSYQSKETGLYIVGVQGLNQLINVTKIVILPFLILAVITSVISFFLAFFIARSFSQPLYEVIKCVEQVEKGDFTARTAIHRKDEFAILGKSVNAMILKIQELISNIKQKERSLRVAEMKALQAQIHPHLIFNTLEMIKWNIRLNNPDEASHIVIQLAKLLRQGIDTKDEMVTVAEEITIVKIYLDIQKHRFEDRLKIEIDIDSGIQKARIPKYIIQPIVENSIVHGLRNKIDNGLITIKGYGIDKDLFFEIIDNGIGMNIKKIQKVLNGDVIYGKKPNGTGMQNVMKRIKLYYGSECGLSIESKPYQGTKIMLKMRNDVII